MGEELNEDYIIHTIKSVSPGSIAQELELVPGDRLLAINGHPVRDVFDYHYLVDDEQLVLLVEKANGEQWELDIEKEAQEDLGLSFENGLMDDYKSCSNKCIFCFIDQMPKGMRDTLYFKDDDSRLSFLQGNYITLTNMKDRDVRRIIDYKLAPINISVHTTNPRLRCRMLNNRFAGEALKLIDRFYEAGIEMNGQIVLCKGVNDGAELERTIGDLTRYLPYMESLSVVPVGLTRFREGLAPLEPFGKEDARAVIAIIESWQERCMAEHGVHFVQASDEWYLTAELPLPEEERYDGYIQLENGVGMIRLLLSEYGRALAAYAGERGRTVPAGTPELSFGAAAADTPEPPSGTAPADTPAPPRRRRITLATGRLVFPFIRQMAEDFMALFPENDIRVVAIRNDFFGERITVSGLITGQDLIAQLKGLDLGEKVCIPANMLRAGEQVFLDDITTEEVERALQVPLDIVKSSGQDFLRAITGDRGNE